MSEKIIVVTPPDDIQIDGFRLVLVDLFHEQTDLLSKTLLNLKNIPCPIITYLWTKNTKAML